MSLTHPPPAPPSNPTSSSDSEDDYMKMTFPDDACPSSTHSHPHKQPETSLQRRQRERREAEIRARVKSKAELAAEETAAREAAQSRSLLLPSNKLPKSKGLAMMAKMGFTGGALGSKDTSNSSTATLRMVEPIRVAIKDGREGIGLESERKRKLREAAEALGAQTKRAKADEEGVERLVYAAQRVAEMMDEERKDGLTVAGDKKQTTSSRPLKSIPVVWRGLIRAREETERDRRMRHDLEQSHSSRLGLLPTYTDAEEDLDDKLAQGKSAAPWTTYVTADDLDEEDTELDAFNALPAAEKMQKLVEYLRGEYRYCFWCKTAYPDPEMDGCPGIEEEDHD
ncbi:hypothetical protein B0T19DRAFT_406686 [Cercophora scortea]|uniref:G-patch domain-containing protein n=1 Tax=Cercophora scortea TaxID=314031 RepID=A0AAE0MK76_9PEZI|nr:hypothetical protein B0T19DRAFT_406686 [Cercophora scortea]